MCVCVCACIRVALDLIHGDEDGYEHEYAEQGADGALARSACDASFVS